MPEPIPARTLAMRSTLTAGGELRLGLHEVDLPAPGPDDVVVRVEASPINPSDILVLLGPADPADLKAAEIDGRPGLVAQVPAERMGAMGTRLDLSLPVGNEGAGEVIAAGVGAAAQALLGRRVAMRGGGMYAQHRTLRAADCLPLADGADPEDGAAAYVNPMTALSFPEVMRAEGHSALIHTAAASNLGRMLVRICRADGVGLVNIVRSEAQAEILRAEGAEHICISSAPDFDAKLEEAVAATGATLAFDAVGGGDLGGRIINAMERGLARDKPWSPYGTSVKKQVYHYGLLDEGPIVIPQGMGLCWGAGGWLLTNFLAAAGGEVAARLRARVAAELPPPFASRYTARVSLAEALDPETARAWARRATGEKYLVRPDREI